MSETVPPLAIMKAYEEVSKIRSTNSSIDCIDSIILQVYTIYVTAARCICDTPPHLVNIEHIGDNDLESSSE